ncbi:capsular biosynthesis protein CpsI, partial [Acinetobacter baumannii]
TADPAYDPNTADPARSSAPYRVFNIGNHAPIQLMSFIEAIEQSVGREAIKNFMPMQDGDVPATHADVEELAQWTGFRPAMPVPEGI